MEEQDELFITCNGCDAREAVQTFSDLKHHTWMRSDAYGLSTGCYCDDCYEHNYPYRKDNYFDPEFCGERMDDDY
jgi:hypothetical protein